MKSPTGDVITGAENQKIQTLEQYKTVLSNRPIKAGMEKLQNDKEELLTTKIRTHK